MDFATKYRPNSLPQVVGHTAVVRSLGKCLTDPEKRPHALLFHGRAGLGKTSLARIVASVLGAHPSAVTEVNAAMRTGVDDWRKELARIDHLPLAGDVKVVIVDECHALSPASWKVLLKPIEEPPAHVCWVLCTTDRAKVPPTIVSRCLEYELRPVRGEDLCDLVERVVGAEQVWAEWSADDRTAAIWDVVSYAEGSPRQALTGLEAAAGAETREQALTLLARSRPAAEVRDLCKQLARGSLTFASAVAIVKRFPAGTDPESVRRTMVGYCSAIVMSPKTDAARLPSLLRILEVFADPYTDRGSYAPLLLSLGRLYFNG